MKKITYFKTIIVAIVLLVGSASVSAQLLVENFNYPKLTGRAATVLSPAQGWSYYGGDRTGITINDGLFFTGYIGSGIGQSAYVNSYGLDYYKPFVSQTTGNIYAAFMVDVDVALAGDFFIHFGPPTGIPSQSTVGACLFIKKDPASTKFAFGISKNGDDLNVVTFTGFDYSLATTYLVVIKYSFKPGLQDDCALFINPALSATEPSPIVVTSIVDNDNANVPSIGSICLREGTNYLAPALRVDGIRVGASWNDAIGIIATPVVSNPTFSVTEGIYTMGQSVTLSSITPNASIYYTLDGTDPNNTGNGTLFNTTPIAITSTTTIKAIAYVTAMTTSSITKAMYTLPAEVTNIGALRTSSLTGFYKLTGEAFLTFQSAAAKVKYVQDATAGIVIYDATSKITTAYNVGDGIKNMYCTLSMLNGMLQLVPFSDPGAANSTGNVITPAIVTLTSLANYPGQLVKVKGLKITENGNFDASSKYTINNGTVGALRTPYSDSGIVGTVIPTSYQDVTGVVLNYSTVEVDLVPRTIVDFVGLLPTTFVTENAIPTIATSIGGSSTQTIHVSGSNLTDQGGILLSVSGTDADLFKLSTYNVAQTGGTAASTLVTITYSNLVEGSNTATLTLSCVGSLNLVLTLNGTGSATTELNNVKNLLNISVLNGNIKLNALAGDNIEICNAIGQKLFSKIAIEGLNIIHINTKGILIVKSGNRVTKVII